MSIKEFLGDEVAGFFAASPGWIVCRWFSTRVNMRRNQHHLPADAIMSVSHSWGKFRIVGRVFHDDFVVEEVFEVFFGDEAGTEDLNFILFYSLPSF